MQKLKKVFSLVFLSLVVLVIAGEVIARYGLGLGNPPLYMEDSNIEYMLKPNLDLYRFGNHYIVNQYGMRSTPFGRKKDEEIRILLFGDSVLNGGTLTRHTELATTLLEERLNELYDENVVVGNVSASSWGPGNWLAYAQEYGFFNADMVILVISSDDYKDNPTFGLLDVHHPTKKPVSALVEGFERYFVPRYLSAFSSTSKKPNGDSLKQQKKGLEDLRQFLTLAKNNSDSVMVFQHWDRAETKNDLLAIGNKLIQELSSSLNIPVIELGSAYQRAIQKHEQPFRDGIHVNPLGQRLIFQTILKNLPEYGSKHI